MRDQSVSRTQSARGSYRAATAPSQPASQLADLPTQLTYVNDQEPGLTRRQAGKAWVFRDPKGKRLSDPRTIQRIKSLAIPPAWTEVWICATESGHLQATGRDARGRKQYIYHAQFREHQENNKYRHMVEFAAALPGLREQVLRDLKRSALPREKVIAAIISLLETTLIRVGNSEYAKKNRSYGITTLRTPHVHLDGNDIRFRFSGKSGKAWNVSLTDRRIAGIIRACQELPGQHLFQYTAADGQAASITSTDVNRYLQDVTGLNITAKDFRTWAGTVMAASILHERNAAEGGPKSHVIDTVKRVAGSLGNTPAICRKCYIHPTILDLFAAGELHLKVRKSRSQKPSLTPVESAVLALLKPQRRSRSGQSASHLS